MWGTFFPRALLSQFLKPRALLEIVLDPELKGNIDPVCLLFRTSFTLHQASRAKYAMSRV